MTDAPHILIVEARFYGEIADEMVRGAVAELRAVGATHERIEVPGAFEIPTAIGIAARSRSSAGRERFNGYIALGCVIRGETSHYDYVCVESARKLQDLACDRCLALGYGILTCENGDQAWDRARIDRKNKGGDAARACLRMIEVRRRLGV